MLGREDERHTHVAERVDKDIANLYVQLLRIFNKIYLLMLIETFQADIENFQ